MDAVIDGVIRDNKSTSVWKFVKQEFDDYIKQLGTITNSKAVGEFRKQLRDRVAEDEKIVAAGEKHPRYAQAKEELDRYEMFLDHMGHKLWFIFHGTVDLEKNNALTVIQADEMPSMTDILLGRKGSLIVGVDEPPPEPPEPPSPEPESLPDPLSPEPEPLISL